MSIDFVTDLIKNLEKIQKSQKYVEMVKTKKMIALKKNNPKVYHLLQKNKEFCNKHMGERCFILGNGPSLNDIDFELLSDEVVFTSNLLPFHEEFYKLKTNYHFLMDGGAFGLRKDLRNVEGVCLKALKKLPPNSTLFVPILARKFVCGKRLNQFLDIRYISVGENYFGKKGSYDVDITKYISSFTTVVQYAILTAIYMGFKEIYLLGCDNTIIKHVLDVALNNERENDHAYSIEGGLKFSTDSLKQCLKNDKLSYILEDASIISKGYEELAKYCKKKGIKFANLSSITLIDSVERMNVDEVLKK